MPARGCVDSHLRSGLQYNHIPQSTEVAWHASKISMIPCDRKAILCGQSLVILAPGLVIRRSHLSHLYSRLRRLPVLSTRLLKLRSMVILPGMPRRVHPLMLVPMGARLAIFSVRSPPCGGAGGKCMPPLFYGHCWGSSSHEFV